jgi:hypothetical protein
MAPRDADRENSTGGQVKGKVTTDPPRAAIMSPPKCIDEEGFRKLLRALERAAAEGAEFDAIWPAWLQRVADCFEPRDRALRVFTADQEKYRATFDGEGQ